MIFSKASRRRRPRLSRVRTVSLKMSLVVVLAGGLVFLGVLAGRKWDSEMARMGCDAPIEDVISLAPVQQDANVLRFIAVGDTGTGTVGQAQVAQGIKQVCDRDGCDFMLMLGDNIYPAGAKGLGDIKFETHIAEVYGPLNIPIYPVLGNHDVRNPALNQVLYSLINPQWQMPNYQYQFSTGLAQFHAINTNCSLLAFNNLADDLVDSSAPWRLVYGHHTLLSTGVHGGADPLTKRLWKKDLADQTDFYVSGHNHVLEHLSEADQRTHYVVSGTGGWIGPSGKTPHPTTESDATSHFRTDNGGFAYFALTRTQALLRFHNGDGQIVYEHLRKR